MMNDNNTAAQSGTDTQLEGNGVQPERTFTQEEVNRIISERLARERSKAEPTEEEKRISDLNARESKVTCSEWLIGKGYPENIKTGMLEMFDTSNADNFKNNVEKLLKTFPAIIEPINNPVLPTTGGNRVDDKLASIFKPNI